MLINELMIINEQKNKKKIIQEYNKFNSDFLTKLLSQLVEDFPQIDHLKQLKNSKFKKYENKYPVRNVEIKNGDEKDSFYYHHEIGSYVGSYVGSDTDLPNKSRLSVRTWDRKNQEFNVVINFSDVDYKINNVVVSKTFNYDIFNNSDAVEIVMKKLYPTLMGKIKRKYNVLF